MQRMQGGEESRPDPFWHLSPFNQRRGWVMGFFVGWLCPPLANGVRSDARRLRDLREWTGDRWYAMAGLPGRVFLHTKTRPGKPAMAHRKSLSEPTHRIAT